MNIVVSGWPGAGTTTLSLLLANLIEFKYVYAGGVMKFLAQQIVGQTSGPEFIKFEEQMGPFFDILWEPYAAWKLKKSDKMLMEGKTTGFFVEGENFYEIMLIAQTNARINRATKDGRVNPGPTIEARDEKVRSRWIQEFGIDIYNPNQVQDNYDLILDTTNLSIEQELEQVLSGLEEDFRFPSSDLDRQRKMVKQLVETYNQQGKPYFLKQLQDKKLLLDAPQVLKEWHENFKAELGNVPLAIQKIVYHYGTQK